MIGPWSLIPRTQDPLLYTVNFRSAFGTCSSVNFLVKSLPGPPVYAICLQSTGLHHDHHACTGSHTGLHFYTAVSPKGHSTPWTRALSPLVTLDSQYLAQGFKWILCCVSHSVVPILCDPMDHSPPGSSVHGILQARILAWVAIPFSRWSRSRNQTWVSNIAGRFFTIWATREDLNGFWLLLNCKLPQKTVWRHDGFKKKKQTQLAFAHFLTG